MEKTMMEISVKTTEEGRIIIEQSRYESDVILLAPEQIDILIKWLQDAKNEIQQRSMETDNENPSRRNLVQHGNSASLH